MKSIIILIASSTIAFSGEISGSQLQQERLNKQSGTFLVTDTVERISGSGLDKNRFDVRVGGETITVTFSGDSGTSYTYTGNSITLADYTCSDPRWRIESCGIAAIHCKKMSEVIFKRLFEMQSTYGDHLPKEDGDYLLCLEESGPLFKAHTPVVESILHYE